ncbi:MAG: VanZ family protein [Ruminococcus sp.]|nr:VanZ family protein [Ruminococcus sp.]
MKSKRITVFIKICFIIYLLALLYLLFLQRIFVRGSRIQEIEDYGFWQSIKWSVNLIPFRTILDYIQQMDPISIHSVHDYAFQNIIGNIIWFLPMGVFLPYFSQKQRNFLKFFLTAFFMIVCIEIMQLITLLGSCDIDDLLLNLLGSCIGFGIFYLIKPVLLKQNN